VDGKSEASAGNGAKSESAQPAAKVEKAVKAVVEKPDLNAKTDPAKSTAAGVAASPTGAGQE
jgi:hypothetical protein